MRYRYSNRYLSSYSYLQYLELEEGRDCALECGPDKTCYPDTCCPKKVPSKKKSKEENATNGDAIAIRQRHNNTPPAVESNEL